MSDYRKYVCTVCGHIYDEAEGDPENGIQPGTRWDNLPESWTCPECGAEKNQFELLEPLN
ncbi:rubredoxin [Methylogaea oryzae]|uniref:Rubredoxin n=1 Tax=Methylogaea oryzae TaxID=1295382 RepID=A0A8D4VMT7_9GAMM|nr:rubredoxin [Methylogaea oryzae]BBL71078.1 rubredoxin [Methylogaea oryzae]